LGVAAFTAPSPSTNWVTYFGNFDGGGLYKVRFRRTDSYGGNATYSITSNPSGRSYSANVSAPKDGTIASNSSIDIYLPGDFSAFSLTFTISLSGYTSASTTVNIPAGTYTGWNELSIQYGKPSGWYYKGLATQNVYHSGPWKSTRFYSSTGAGPYYGMNRLPDSSGAIYWPDEATTRNWTDDQLQRNIITVVLGGSNPPDLQAITNGTISYYTGTGWGPISGLGTPSS